MSENEAFDFRQKLSATESMMLLDRRTSHDMFDPATAMRGLANQLILCCREGCAFLAKWSRYDRSVLRRHVQDFGGHWRGCSSVRYAMSGAEKSES